MFVKDVDERAFGQDERVLRPEDALHMAVNLFDMAEYGKLEPRLRDRADVVAKLPRWEDASADTQWVFFHRALQALQQAEAQRRAPEAVELDPADPGLALARER